MAGLSLVCLIQELRHIGHFFGSGIGVPSRIRTFLRSVTTTFSPAGSNETESSQLLTWTVTSGDCSRRTRGLQAGVSGLEDAAADVPVFE